MTDPWDESGIITDPWMVDFYGKLVGKYTSPLDQAKSVAQSCFETEGLRQLGC